MAMTISEQSYINNAINRARGAFDNAIASSKRNAERMGINPNSGRYAAIEQDAQYAKAAGIASTGNEASFNWLKQAQDQANQDALMEYRYSALNQEADLARMRNQTDREIAEAQYKFKGAKGKEAGDQLGLEDETGWQKGSDVWKKTQYKSRKQRMKERLEKANANAQQKS